MAGKTIQRLDLAATRQKDGAGNDEFTHDDGLLPPEAVGEARYGNRSDCGRKGKNRSEGACQTISNAEFCCPVSDHKRDIRVVTEGDEEVGDPDLPECFPFQDLPVFRFSLNGLDARKLLFPLPTALNLGLPVGFSG